MVVGIVHNNGILMLDSEQDFSGCGYPLRDAIFHAGRRRLCPIVMTALSTLNCSADSIPRSKPPLARPRR
jgi:multidrug efflux pump subunit AcrB